MDQLTDVYSVSGCINEDFADYINFWKHNGFWLFDSPEIITALAAEHSLDLSSTILFYYEVYEREFNGKAWVQFQPEPSFSTNVVQRETKKLEGYDVVSFLARNAPEHSPLSCNGLAREIPTNTHCLLNSFEEAFNTLDRGGFTHSEPGPYRIFAVYSVDWPEEQS